MAHIVEFSISNLVGRKGVYSQKLNRGVNVFFGLNGSGKTSLLKILHSAMSGNAVILNNVPFKRAVVKIYSIHYDNVFTRVIEKTANTRAKTIDSDASNIAFGDSEIGEFVYTESQESIKIAWTVEPMPPQDFVGGWFHRYLPTSRLYLGAVPVPPVPLLSEEHIKSSLAQISEEQLDLYFARALQNLWSRYSAGILAAVRDAQEDGFANILKAILSAREQKEAVQEVDSETAYNCVAAFLKRQGSPDILGSPEEFAARYRENPQLRSVVSDINGVEEKIRQAMEPREKLQSLVQGMFSGNKEIFFRDTSIDVETNEKTKIGLNVLSSGEKHLLRILIETLLADESSILIDEPEISVHVDWQRQLINTMRQLNPSAQLILATHSPEIMADIDDDRILSL